MRKILFSIVLLGLCHQTALADSDGYFCAAKGYLAYETSVSEPGVGHRLHIVRFGSRIGIAQPVTLTLDEFQTHAMRCAEDRIEIQGWDTKYTVDISDLSRPKLAGTEKLTKPGGILPGFSQQNLGNWAKPAVIDLASDASDSVFELVIARAEKPINGGIYRYTASELVRRAAGSNGAIQEALNLFRGIFLETVD